jgi:hypothetical protein
VIVVIAWGPFTYRRSTRWTRVAAFWEREIEKIVAIPLPDYLRQKEWLKTGGWEPGDSLEPWYLQPIYLGQALITLFFGLLLVVALVSKTI